MLHYFAPGGVIGFGVGTLLLRAREQMMRISAVCVWLTVWVSVSDWMQYTCHTGKNKCTVGCMCVRILLFVMFVYVVWEALCVGRMLYVKIDAPYAHLHLCGIYRMVHCVLSLGKCVYCNVVCMWNALCLCLCEIF